MLTYRYEMLCRICIVPVSWARSCRLHVSHPATWGVDHTVQEYICPEMSRSWTVVGTDHRDHRDHTDHLSEVRNISHPIQNSRSPKRYIKIVFTLIWTSKWCCTVVQSSLLVDSRYRTERGERENCRYETKCHSPPAKNTSTTKTRLRIKRWVVEWWYWI